ncbi:MAG: hypothetical protein GX221_08235 [Candidatus Riflebacteria bacterium]|nr:hypothetical protein [Candidatus Riflebacteria bacterium]
MSLGFSATFSTVAGIVFLIIFTVRLELPLSKFDTFLLISSILPFLLGDTVNAYVMSRLKHDIESEWYDIAIAINSKQIVAKYYRWIRSVSVVSAFSGVLVFLLSHFNLFPKLLYVLKFVFPVSFAILGIICLQNIVFAIDKEVNANLRKKITFSALTVPPVFLLLYAYLLLNPQMFSHKAVIFFYSLFYLGASAAMQPVPTKYSLSSFLRGLGIGAFQETEDQLIARLIAEAKEMAEKKKRGEKIPLGAHEIVDVTNIVHVKGADVAASPVNKFFSDIEDAEPVEELESVSLNASQDAFLEFEEDIYDNSEIDADPENKGAG